MLGSGTLVGDVRRGSQKIMKSFFGGGGIGPGIVVPLRHDCRMSESSVVAARRVVMDSMAALRALERTGDAECRIDGLKSYQVLRRQCEYDSLMLVAGLDREGAFAERGMHSANAVTDLLGLSQRDGRRMVAVASSVFPTRS